MYVSKLGQTKLTTNSLRDPLSLFTHNCSLCKRNVIYINLMIPANFKEINHWNEMAAVGKYKKSSFKFCLNLFNYLFVNLKQLNVIFVCLWLIIKWERESDNWKKLLSHEISNCFKIDIFGCVFYIYSHTVRKSKRVREKFISLAFSQNFL